MKSMTCDLFFEKPGMWVRLDFIKNERNQFILKSPSKLDSLMQNFYFFPLPFPLHYVARKLYNCAIGTIYFTALLIAFSHEREGLTIKIIVVLWESCQIKYTACDVHLSFSNIVYMRMCDG